MLSAEDLNRRKRLQERDPIYATMEWAYLCIEGKYEEFITKNRERLARNPRNRSESPFYSESVLTKPNKEKLLLRIGMCISSGHNTYKIKHFTFSGIDKVLDEQEPNPPNGIACVKYDRFNGWDTNPFKLETYSLNNISIVDCPGPLIISEAPHIGKLKLDLKKQFPEGNSMHYEPFISGKDYVRLNKDNRFIFRIDALQNYWDTGRILNPLTGLPAKRGEIERFTYIDSTKNNVHSPKRGGTRKNSKKSSKLRKRKH